MEINIESTLDELRELVEDVVGLEDPKDLLFIRNQMTVPAANLLLSRYETPNSLGFTDRTGGARASGRVEKGTRRYPTQIRFGDHDVFYLPILAGTEGLDAFDWPARLLNENRIGAANAAVNGGRTGWVKLAKRTERASKKLRAKLVRTV